MSRQKILIRDYPFKIIVPRTAAAFDMINILTDRFGSEKKKNALWQFAEVIYDEEGWVIRCKTAELAVEIKLLVG